MSRAAAIGVTSGDGPGQAGVLLEDVGPELHRVHRGHHVVRHDARDGVRDQR